MVLPRGSEAGQGATPPGPPTATEEIPAAASGSLSRFPAEVIARDAAGHLTIRATRVASPLRIDGRLDEAVYASVQPMSDFIQNDPQEGSLSTERTEVWLLFDSNNVYVVARCWESRPERMVANEMRRDNPNIAQNDSIAFGFDTFYDRRNSVFFETNAIGGRLDGQVTSERQVNLDWNPVWEVKVGRFDGGWTAEAAIPFKSLRYRPRPADTWGFNVRRVNRWKNEVSYLTRIPASMTLRGHFQSSLMATVVGLEVPAGSRNLEIKPYATSNLTTDVNTTPRISNDPGGDLGVDVKFGVTQGLTADVTYRTDFAQVEADEQQVNLTRFSLFFPEKRDFFLENQGTFAFGGAAVGGPGQAMAATPSDTPLLFYSRRVGLSQGGNAVPVAGGGRLTGRAGKYSLGLLNIQSDDEPLSESRATNFSVARLKRDILRKSSIGAIFTGRSIGESGIGTNEAYGVDGAFAFYDNLSINTYWARTRTSALSGEDTSYRAQLDYTGDRYGVQIERLVVGEHFNPEAGFLRRHDMRRNFAQFRFSPRPGSSERIRRFFWMGSLAYIQNGAGRLETRDSDGEFALEFQSGDRFSVGYGHTYEFLPEPFLIGSGITLPVQGYDFATVRTGFNLGRQRRISGNISVESGTFYSGHKTTLSWSQGRVNITPQFSLEPRLSLDWVDLREGSFTSRVVGSRVTYTITPMMFASALLQYSSGSNVVGANVRLRWEYRPGSELFVVFNEQRDTLARGFPELGNRALIIKINRLFRF
jgi:hypothetical protein